MRSPRPAPKASRLTPPTAGTLKFMRANRGKGTRLELAVRQALWRRGVRGYRVNVSKFPGKPDIVFPRARLCVFLHGCFWHGCPKCARRRNLTPTANASYWKRKIESNKERDAANRLRLEQEGWSVVQFWECEVHSNLGEVLDSILTQIHRR